LSTSDIEEGPELGRGCFSNVREVKSQRSLHSIHSQRSFQIECDDEEGLSSKSQVSTEFDAATDQPSRSYYYAVKKLRKDLSESNRMNGAIDLAVEAQFLTSLSHKNIVNLEGVGDNPGSKEFFIIVEKLDRTLTTEITAWKRQHRYIKEGNIPRPRNKSVKDMINAQLDSILVHAYDLSSALAYLHTKK
jgi:serine/threonine protein kinase